MTDKKYILTDETKEVNGHILHRIKAIKNFGDVKAGTLGGWIEKEENLSHNNLCWVAGEACVYGNAWVALDAQIFEQAKVFGTAWIMGNAKVYGNACIFEDPVILEYAEIFGDAKVYGGAFVGNYTKLNTGEFK